MDINKAAKNLGKELFVLYRAFLDKRTPWYAKALAALVVAYAVSPIDLIPDFIPVIGHLDDAVIIPLGLSLCRKLIPKEVLEEHGAGAEVSVERFSRIKTVFYIALAVLWLLCAALLVLAIVYLLKRIFS